MKHKAVYVEMKAVSFASLRSAIDKTLFFPLWGAFFSEMSLMLPDGNIMNTDVVLGHAEQEVGKLDIQEERKIMDLPVHV